ncbi:hypothetical protein ABEB36_012475 [Hypothenemus hampei]|uniref:C2H2-type domain-containing protein n=1 Tax=Hypothenemus hampei TaxID=57062 RepID=A0ABD1EBG7_HYPHA
MVSNKNTKRSKKPIETTLGKAPTKNNDEENDISHLKKPIETNIAGIKQLLSVWSNATNEVKALLMFECDVMYECRTCRTIFRSLANFLLHKRNYCTDKFLPNYLVPNTDTFKINIEPHLDDKSEISPLEKVVQKLHEIEEIRESAKYYLNEESDSTTPKSMEDLEVSTSDCKELVLEDIESNSSAKFQTLTPSVSNQKRKEFMRSEVMEVHKKLKGDTPVIDSEGKVISYTNSNEQTATLYPKSDLKCLECSHRFATQKSLTNHIKRIHNPCKLLYVCPTCKDTFANPWCVYRHLLKVHRLSNKQVRRMREQVHNSCISRAEQVNLLKRKSNSDSIQGQEENRDNQWINDIEGDKDFQICVGCGKHFERKAALHSHSQMCVKRLEVCNTIKENAKKKEEEAVEKAKLDKLASDRRMVKGASKRKSRAVFFRKSRQVCNKDDVSSKENEDVKEQKSVDLGGPSLSPSSSCKIISRSNSIDEAIYLSSSDDPAEEQQDDLSSDYTTPTKQEEQNQNCETTALQVKTNLFSDNVSFEAFCQKIGNNDIQEKSQLESNQDENDDDVIFISETINNLQESVIDDNDNADQNNDKVMVELPTNNSVFLTKANPYIDRSTLSCIPCEQSFLSHNLLLLHMSAHFSWFRFQCGKCSFVAYSKFHCLSHAKKDHKLKGSVATRAVLPLPNWKSILMSHDFRPLNSEDLTGKHTDEKIAFVDPNQEENSDVPAETLVADETLFVECMDNMECINNPHDESDNLNKRLKFASRTSRIDNARFYFRCLKDVYLSRGCECTQKS